MLSLLPRREASRHPSTEEQRRRQHTQSPLLVLTELSLRERSWSCTSCGRSAWGWRERSQVDGGAPGASGGRACARVGGSVCTRQGCCEAGFQAPLPPAPTHGFLQPWRLYIFPVTVGSKGSCPVTPALMCRPWWVPGGSGGLGPFPQWHALFWRLWAVLVDCGTQSHSCAFRGPSTLSCSAPPICASRFQVPSVVTGRRFWFQSHCFSPRSPQRGECSSVVVTLPTGTWRWSGEGCRPFAGAGPRQAPG